jgi:acetyl-CoA acetyltransferase
VLDRSPVIVGVGELKDLPADLTRSLEPLELMARAVELADEDAGGHALRSIDSIDVVHQVSWRYERTAASLCERLAISPARAVYGFTGGESPVRYLHEAALRIARGESEVAAVCGAEAQYAVNKAGSASITLPWRERAAAVENPLPREGLLNPLAIAHGIVQPIQIYPLYENATLAAWQQTPEAALAESGELWARYSRVAASNPYSWATRALTAEEITRPSRENRLIAYPYTKHMVANPAVNQGAAIILTTLANARAWKIPDDRLVFVWGGAAAHEPRDYLLRDQYERSDAQDFVLEETLRAMDANAGALEAIELYSCFPCVPKMARRALGLDAGVTPTVTGGLSFFGAPLNDYMTHAACAMVRHLRAGRATTGLLYGQGEFVTKHHALAVARTPPRNALTPDYSVQSRVDRNRGTVPALLAQYEGRAHVETHTVVYDREGEPAFGAVIARTPEGARLTARVPASDRDAIGVLTNRERSPVGLSGTVTAGEKDLLRFRFA